MFRLRIFFLFFISFSLCGFAQNYPDIIYTKKGDTLRCKITLVNDKNIFYLHEKRKLERDSSISLDSIHSYNWVSNTSGLEKNMDSIGKNQQTVIIPNSNHNINNSKPYWSNFIGAGIQLLAPFNNDSHAPQASSSFQYKQPSYFLLYRLIHKNKNFSRDALTVTTNYRSGSINITSGGLGGSGTIAGNFEVVRIDGGFTHFFTFGDYKETSLGLGIYFGGIISATGSFDEYGTGMLPIYNYYHKNELNAYQILNHAYGGISLEYQNQLKINANNYLVIGIRVQIESPEGSGARIGKIAGLFLGYRFWKKQKT